MTRSEAQTKLLKAAIYLSDNSTDTEAMRVLYAASWRVLTDYVAELNAHRHGHLRNSN